MSVLIDDAGVPSIAVIGGGFAGTMVAVHLARMAGSAAGVWSCSRRDAGARGLAYGTRCDRHLLNVPAGLMSALPEEPSHFLEWLRSRDAEAMPGRSRPAGLRRLPRRPARAEPTRRVDRPRHSARRGGRPGAGPGRPAPLPVTTTAGRRVAADRAVLALGNQPPQPLPCLAERPGSSIFARPLGVRADFASWDGTSRSL